jgi:hypothetical protein
MTTANAIAVFRRMNDEYQCDHCGRFDIKRRLIKSERFHATRGWSPTLVHIHCAGDYYRDNTWRRQLRVTALRKAGKLPPDYIDHTRWSNVLLSDRSAAEARYKRNKKKTNLI